jgi:excisionase family DNA binding protein
MGIGFEALPMTKLLTTDEVASLLSVKPSTIRKWVHLEQIPVVRLGRAVRFRPDKIEEWVKAKSISEKTWDN